MKYILLFLTFLTPSLQFNSFFELDGNPETTSTLDWDLLTDSNIYTGVIQDPAPQTIFMTGKSKDINDVSEWRHTDGSVPDKDDITNAYAYATTYNENLIVYMGADRFANSGDAASSFWFFQDDVHPLPTGRFSGTHKNGDLLVIQNFGQEQDVFLYEWRDEEIQPLGSLVDATCNFQDQLACAITNTVPINSPWPYSPKSGIDGVFPEFSFLEGAVNLNELYNGSVPCFTSFMAVTRSSTSITSQLKDFVSGSFEVCKVDVAINCVNATLNNDARSVTFDFDISVSNNGFGRVYDVEVYYDFQLLQLFASLDVGETQNVQGSFNSSNLDVQTKQAAVIAYPFPNNVGNALVAVSNVSQCPILNPVPNLFINKTCLAFLTSLSNLWVVKANFSGQVCNTGELPLDNVQLVDNSGTPLQSDDLHLNLNTLKVGQCKQYSGSYFPNSLYSSSNLFSDTVNAIGTPPFELANVNASAQASCVLCA